MCSNSLHSHCILGHVVLCSVLWLYGSHVHLQYIHIYAERYSEHFLPVSLYCTRVRNRPWAGAVRLCGKASESRASSSSCIWLTDNLPWPTATSAPVNLRTCERKRVALITWPLLLYNISAINHHQRLIYWNEIQIHTFNTRRQTSYNAT